MSKILGPFLIDGWEQLSTGTTPEGLKIVIVPLKDDKGNVIGIGLPVGAAQNLIPEIQRSIDVALAAVKSGDAVVVPIDTRRTIVGKQVGQSDVLIQFEVNERVSYQTILGPNAARELRDNLTMLLDGNIQAGPERAQ